ncbi:RHS repeat-associated core domain-containing protein [Variovorax sp. PBS-H4]|uniref:RHS repeat-associated core domain-containing protein n=1 Tax=Variovorax sp. PBS-H4 TaxID=434008 RepID=UPI0013A57D32|nr:RHS repeat-associated core domain-containing protein [Variovorax sp. PBS-H4]
MTTQRPWQVVLIVFACFSAHANAKSWYYNNNFSNRDKFYESAEEYCAASSWSGMSFTYTVGTPRIHDWTAYNEGECHYFSPSNPDNEDGGGILSMGIVDCEMPNARPKPVSGMLPTCSCGDGYKLSYDKAYIDTNGLWANRQCLENSPPEIPADRQCDAGLFSGNPILPATAEKYRSETDWSDSGPAPLSVQRIYRSNWASYSAKPDIGLGAAWAHNHGVRLMATPALAPTAVAIAMPDGSRRSFAKPAGASFWVANDNADSLEQSPDAWTYRRADDNTTWVFDSTGKLQAKYERNGWTATYRYDGAGRLSAVTSPFGRVLTFAYTGAGQLDTVTLPDARVLRYQYDGVGRLSSVAYPDGKTRTFLYENAAFAQALTGILDENGSRWATFTYDATGRAITTELAGSVERYQVSYPYDKTATVTDPLGTTRQYAYGSANGKLAVTGSQLPSGTGNRDALQRIQDANGMVTSETDFKGVTTITTWDVARRLPLSVTRAAGTPEAQTVTTQWHPTFSLPVLVTESGRTTAYTYDDKGNVLSQAITDTSSSPSTTRTWNWSWNAQGLAATETAPNGAVTTFEYDARGNLTKTTNALGHVTQYAYDSANRIIRSTPPLGQSTAYTWDSRDRLITHGMSLQPLTTLTYTATGLVERLKLPTGQYFNYTYDAAHRLTGWSSNRGESGSFILDAMGNRTAEQVKDSTGAIAWMAARSINNLNRVSAKTDGPNQTNSFAYDANGELVSETNGLNQSTRYGLDPLRRVKAITNAANATASLSYNALDAVTQAKDFKGVATTYARDAQGNATAESSADIGSTTTRYDALGLPSTLTDALGQATQIQRDLLGRPTLITFADGKTTTLRYDENFSATGYLSSMTDRSGTTTYTRDLMGRVRVKTQALASGLSQQIQYSYTAAGQLAGIYYPEGSALLLNYDTAGRLTQLSWNGRPIVTGIAWNPMGQPTAWNWAFAPGLAASRKYDTAGRMTTTEFASYVYDAAGRITSLTQNLLQPGDSDPMHSSIASANTTWSVSYDAVGRITGFNATGSQTSFGYDANGNRNASTKTLGGQTTSRSYTVNGGSNRLDGFSQTTGTTSTNVAYAYNANGDLTSDGLRTYSYNAEGRLSAVTTGATDTSPTTRYAHNALGQRVFKTEPLYPPTEGDETDQGFMQSLIGFFTKMWGPSTSDAEKLGYAFMYDEDGTLLAETGMGGANSAGSTQYIYLPTANGPMPIAAVINGQLHAVHSDHLNTPRRLTDSQGQPVWQWAYSAFGDTKPTTAHNRFANLDVTPNPGVTSFAEFMFNLRLPGQYFDVESGLHYNGRRSYMPGLGYTQNDPKGLAAGWNRRPYAFNNPLHYTDPDGLNPLAGAIGGAEIGAALGPPGVVVGGIIGAGVGAAVGWWLTGPMLQDKTPNTGEPGSWHTNPGSGQERLYGLDGQPAADIDWDHDHPNPDGTSAGTPHGHNWDWSQKPPRSFPVPISPWPRDRTCPAS